MNIFLVYGTNSSGTAVVAETIAARLRAKGHRLTVQHARDTQPAELGSDYDLLILGSCTWERFTPEGKRLEGQLQQHVYDLLEHSTVPAKRRCALFGLGDSSYTDFCAAADHLEAAIKRWNGQLIVPTLRIDAYYYDLKNNRRIVDEWVKTLADTIYE